jgi:cysteine desulfurase
MGVSGPLQRGVVRVSLGWSTTAADVEKFLTAWTKLATALSKEQQGIAA